ncbi:hypothetical protein EJ110_NYTH25309 [Nymphaea thermarum]|nr:hypothetical protein EJ110_NYTH25309 [Nymphaea thermarum]
MATSRGPTTTPPPIIGKAGRYTVFITPPKMPDQTPEKAGSPEPTPEKASPPVRPPPQQFGKAAPEPSSDSLFGFFWNAVAKVQRVHSGVDEYLADLFGLNQSKYQWALNEYYESKGLDKNGLKPKEITSKGQGV